MFSSIGGFREGDITGGNITVTGGTVAYVGNTTIRTFTGNSTITISGGILNANYIMIGGGGAGGFGGNTTTLSNTYVYGGAGGGAGGVVMSNNIAFPSGMHSVVVGLGQIANYASPTTLGGNSYISISGVGNTKLALGGGLGGGLRTFGNGANGGSGGGGANNRAAGQVAGTLGTPYYNAAGQGSNGAAGTSNTVYNGGIAYTITSQGGGGGGYSSNGYSNGPGGTGIIIITTTTVEYAKGGAGVAQTYVGNGVAANTAGSGGSGAGSTGLLPGNGANGIIFISYPTAGTN